MNPYKKFCKLKIIHCSGCGVPISVRYLFKTGMVFKEHCNDCNKNKYYYKSIIIKAWETRINKLYGGRNDIKKCSQCKIIKSLSEFYPESGKRARSVCKLCESYNRKLRKEYFKKYNKNRYKNYSEEEKNKRAEEHKIYQSRKRKEEAEKLTDSYMRRLLARYSLLKESEIPQELIEYKRAIIKIKREIGK